MPSFPRWISTICPPPLRAAAVVVCAALLAVPACSRGDLRGSDAARLLAGEGVTVSTPKGHQRLAVGDVVPRGSLVRTTGDEARFEFRAGEVWVAPQAAFHAERHDVRLRSGELLVSSGGTLSGGWRDGRVTGEGVYRLTSSAHSRVGVYSGAVAVHRPGEERRLGALREYDLSARRLPLEGAPLAYSDADVWDRRLLAGAIAFDAQVAQVSRGIDRTYEPAPQPVAFYQAFAAVSEGMVPLLQAAARTVDGERFGPPSDSLVTLFVAQAVAEEHDEDLDRSLARVHELRRRGARWGLVATEFGITTGELNRSVNLAQRTRDAATGTTLFALVRRAPAVALAAVAAVTAPAAETLATLPRATVDHPTPLRQAPGDGGRPASSTPQLPTGPGPVDTVRDVVDGILPPPPSSTPGGDTPASSPPLLPSLGGEPLPTATPTVSPTVSPTVTPVPLPLPTPAPTLAPLPPLLPPSTPLPLPLPTSALPAVPGEDALPPLGAELAGGSGDDTSLEVDSWPRGLLP